MKRLFAIAAIATSTITAPLAGNQAAQHDPDKKVAGGGTLPAGWHARLDSGSTKAEGVKFTPMGTGLHFITGPAGIYYKTTDKPSGMYETHATFTQMEPAAHPEAYGLIIGGADLEGASQKYTYFLLRQDGKFLIKRRAGATTPTVMDWTDNAAVKKADAAGKMTNTLAIDVGREKVRFLINGTEVASSPVANVDTNGLAGLRVNHNLNLHVEGFGVK